MFFKIFSLCLFIICFDLFAATKETGLFKEDLTELYAVAFSNNWKTVTSKMEMILEDYEKHHRLDKTIGDLDSLKEFVLAKKLNPAKTKAFLVVYETVKTHGKLVLNTERKISSPATQKNIPALIIYKEEQVNQNRSYKLLGALGFLFLLSVYLKKKKKKLPLKIEEQKLDFEEQLVRQNDIVCWDQVKPEIYRLIFESKVLLKETAGIYFLDDLFSIEFYFLTEHFSSVNFQKLKKIMSENQGELLLVTDYKNVKSEHPTKLVLNFPLS
jgi:hypothetical protein